MKILHVIPSLSPLRGGPSFAIIDMVKSISQLGLTVEIATTDDNSGGTLNVEKGAKIKWKGVNTFFFPKLNSYFKPINEFCFSYCFVDWLEKNILNYDIVHTHGIFSFLPSHALSVGKKKQVPTVARTMGHLDLYSLSRARIKKSLALKLWEKKRLMSAKIIHTTSEPEAANVRKVLGSEANIEVIPLGVNVPQGNDLPKKDARRILGLDLDEKIIVYQSRLDPKKRVDLLLRTVSKLSRVKLAIAGSGDKIYESYLRKLSHSLGLEGRVIWLGWLDGIKRGALLRGGDVFVLHSLSENFGLAAVEAATCGLPVVLSENVDVGQRLSQLGAAVVCKDNRLCEVINNILHKPEKYQFNPEKVRIEYSWNRVALKLRDIYNWMLSLYTR